MPVAVTAEHHSWSTQMESASFEAFQPLRLRLPCWAVHHHSPGSPLDALLPAVSWLWACCCMLVGTRTEGSACSPLVSRLRALCRLPVSVTLPASGGDCRCPGSACIAAALASDKPGSWLEDRGAHAQGGL